MKYNKLKPNKMKNETILEMASDLHPDDFAALMSEMIFLALGDKTPEEGLISHDIILSELSNDYDRSDAGRNACVDAFNMSYDEWEPIYRALSFAAKYEFSTGRVTFGKSDMLEMLASAVNDLEMPMRGTNKRLPKAGKVLRPAAAGAIAYLESL